MMIGAAAEEANRAVTEVDSRINDFFAPRRDRPLIKAIAAVSKVGDQPQLRTLSAFCIAGGLLSSNPRLTRAGVRMLLAHEIATLAKNFIKGEVDRKRPRSADEG